MVLLSPSNSCVMHVLSALVASPHVAWYKTPFESPLYVSFLFFYINLSTYLYIYIYFIYSSLFSHLHKSIIQFSVLSVSVYGFFSGVLSMDAVVVVAVDDEKAFQSFYFRFVYLALQIIYKRMYSCVLCSHTQPDICINRNDAKDVKACLMSIAFWLLK